eukprot:5355687-Pyramimonas_sp.AAC.1
MLLEKANSELPGFEDQMLGIDRFRAATIFLPTRDRKLKVRPKCGALFGGPCAVESFGRAYGHPVNE